MTNFDPTVSVIDIHPKGLHRLYTPARLLVYSLLPGAIPERTACRRASDLGRTLAEPPFPSLKQRAEALAQDVINRADKLTKLEGAA